MRRIWGARRRASTSCSSPSGRKTAVHRLSADAARAWLAPLLPAGLDAHATDAFIAALLRTWCCPRTRGRGSISCSARRRRWSPRPRKWCAPPACATSPRRRRGGCQRQRPAGHCGGGARRDRAQGRRALHAAAGGAHRARARAGARAAAQGDACGQGSRTAGALRMIRIHNSLSGEKQELQPITPGSLRMYVCGLTVYDFVHIGHARMLVVFDMVSRYLRHRGYRLTYVRNITDIDDKIIRRAAENGEPIGRAHRTLHHGHEPGLRAARDRPPRPRAARHAIRAADHQYDRAVCWPGTTPTLLPTAT